jgi:sporulation-control protein spo0M
MGFWDSMRTAVDRVTGSAANVTLSMDPQFIVPGQTVSVFVTIKNGPAALDVRAVFLEVESIERIELPRSADWTNVVADAVAATSRTQKQTHTGPEVARHDETTFESKVTVAPGMNLTPGEERKFKGTFRLPGGVQPSYEGKYAKHLWRVRARLDVLGVDPGTGWLSFRVGNPS